MKNSSTASPNITSPRGRRPGYKTYLRETITERSRSAYERDVEHFREWDGTIPSTPARIAGYLARYAGELAVSTLSRRLIAIGRAHVEQNHPNPVRDPRVKTTLRGIKRTFGTKQKQASPLLDSQLKQLAKSCGNTTAGRRDRALLMIGFAAALRRSELAAIRVEDLHFSKRDLVLVVPYSKTDQEKQGRKVAIPGSSHAFCPVRALRAWLEMAKILDGPVFRKVDRFGVVGRRALHASVIGEILRKRMHSAGLDSSGYSAHSLRAGLVTSAAKAGVPGWKIRQQTGHKSDAALARYIRDQQIFENNAAAVFSPK